jgi:oxygen-independent coproporphyrinogen-3 oxidase
VTNAAHLYVHVPFCTRKCSYCDFAIAVRRTVPVNDYLRGIEAELRSIEPNAALETIYLGGGTPSRLGADGVSELIRLVRARFAIARDAEVTIEANPEDISAATAAAWRDAGINRVSIGVQSFDDEVLRWMHRVHSAADARRAFADTRAAGLDNVSLDLIFALPPELRRDWRADLEQALDLAPSHVSLYGLTIEPHTPLFHWRERGLASLTEGDRYADEFLLADAMATAHGYHHYEVSNFALPSRESRHNSAYWSGSAYIGIGPSAHSFDCAQRWWNEREYSEWLRRLDSGASPVNSRESLTELDMATERGYLGLRTKSGFAPGERDLEQVRRWSRAGWATIDDGVVRLTPEGWLRLDSLAAGLTGF